MTRYLDLCYPPDVARGEYRFLLDLLAGVFGQSDFATLIARQRSLKHFRQVPSVLRASTWFALHGADPVARLLSALRKFEDLLDSGRRFFPNPQAFMGAIEEEHASQHESFPHVEEIFHLTVSSENSSMSSSESS